MSRRTGRVDTGTDRTHEKGSVDRIVVFVLDRPRHQALIDEIRATGARVVLRSKET